MQSSGGLRAQGWKRVTFGATLIAVLASLVGLAGAPATASPDLRSYANTIVHRVGDTTSPSASWFVTSDLKRLYIPDAATYACFRKRGVADRGPVRADVLLKLQDQVRLWASCGDRMTANRELRKGMFLRSSEGRFKLILQRDGNLVLYGPPGALWSTQQFDTAYAVLQADGNFVSYRADNTPNWSTDTRLEDWTTGTRIRSDRLVVQSDGNLVLYTWKRAVWSSETAALK
jgi:hypothetical protein